MKVLYEAKVKGEDLIYEGYTTNYIKVLSPFTMDIVSEIRETKMIKLKEDYAIGEIEFNNYIDVFIIFNYHIPYFGHKIWYNIKKVKFSISRFGGDILEDCIFCKIIKGEIPCKKVYEDEVVICFKDINPEAPVHLLIVPKVHIA